jgi:hypothetical protein
MQKFIGSLFFAWDEELRCPITGEIPICNSSDLNEELGQVSFILVSYFNFKMLMRHDFSFKMLGSIPFYR